MFSCHMNYRMLGTSWKKFGKSSLRRRTLWHKMQFVQGSADIAHMLCLP